MTHSESELVSRSQLVKMLRVSDSKERRMRKKGHPWPPHLRIGSKVYYRRAAVDSFLSAQEALSARVAELGELAAEPEGLDAPTVTPTGQQARGRLSQPSADTTGLQP